MHKRSLSGSIAALLGLAALLSAGAVSGWAASGPPPTVKRLTPNSGSINGGTPVHIAGNGLAPVAERCVAADIAKCRVTVRFGRKEATVLFDSPHNAVVIVPAVARPKTVHVRVSVAGRKSAANAASRFTYTEEGEELEEKLAELEEKMPAGNPLEEGLKQLEEGAGSPPANPLEGGQQELEAKLGEALGGLEAPPGL